MTTKTKSESPLRMIDPAIIFRNPNNPRPDLGDLSELTASVEAHGIIHPILVRPCEGGYMVVAGSRRLAVALRLELRSIPCQVKDMDDGTAFEIATAENIVRKDMSVIDEIRAVEALALSGESHEEIAARFGRPPRWVATRARIAAMPDEVLELIEAGRLGLALAEELAKVADADEQKRLAKWAVDVEADIQSVRNQISYVLRDLDDAPWAKKECAGCLLRSDKQCNLFGDTDGPARCMDSRCWDEKRSSWVAKKEAELRKAGHLPKEQFHASYAVINAFAGYLLEGRDDEDIAELVEAGVKPRYFITEDNQILLRYYYPDMPEKTVKTASGDDEPEAELEDAAEEECEEPEDDAEDSQPRPESPWMRTQRLRAQVVSSVLEMDTSNIDLDSLLEFTAEVLRCYMGNNPMDKAIKEDGVESVVGMDRNRLRKLLLAAVAGELFQTEGGDGYGLWKDFAETFGIAEATDAGV